MKLAKKFGTIRFKNINIGMHNVKICPKFRVKIKKFFRSNNLNCSK